MKRLLTTAALAAVLASGGAAFAGESSPSAVAGRWDAVLTRNGVEIPFRLDVNAKGGKVEDSKFAQVGSEFRINNGPAAIYWNPAQTASGSYTVSATFTEPKYMSSMDHPHPYGLFIAGNKLDTDQASFLYCTPYGNGSFIVRGMGPAPFAMGARRPTPHEAVKKAETGGPVTQEVAWVVTPEKADCKINGVVVASYPKAELVAAGKLESLDGIAGIRAAHNVDFNVTNWKITK